MYFVSFGIYAQVGGENIYNFLNLTAAAKQAALGGNVLTLLDDVNQPLWNPATINSNLDNHLAVNYLDYLATISLTSASYAKYIPKLSGVLHTGLSYLHYGNFIASDENGVETGTFKAYDFSFSVGYAYNITHSNIYLGTNIKWVYSAIYNYVSYGVSADFGVLYYNKNNPYTLTLVLRNAGYQIKTYNKSRENFPVQVALGIAYQLKNVPIKWHLTLGDLQKWQLAVSNPSNETITIDGGVTEEKNNFFKDCNSAHFNRRRTFFRKCV